ncbi:MAG: DUF2264 domain-containing protein [Sphaerochaetaceae bacterium]|nr:DUF2264 domain-containing protein [Sphaerochaetaceae bacterium]
MRTYNLPITKNPLLTRNDVANSLIEILNPCKNALSLDGAGLFVGNTSAHYSSRVTLFEGWSRLLWGLAPLRAGGYNWDGQNEHFNGFKIGVDNSNENYWGDVKDVDQRMVEMAAMALALILTPQFYWDPLTSKEKNNLLSWLSEINKHEISHNNWLYFRVLVNLALEKLNSKEFNQELMERDLVELEDMYVDDGWYKDKDPFDNYNPWAMQFYSIIYYYLKKDTDVQRCLRFKERVYKFAKQHINLINTDGSIIPYGRSLTYRFGVTSFYSACAFASLEVLPYGVMKGIILRNLRWWFNKPIFDRDGFLTIGYVHPSLIFAEEYNAPGSPYWSLKTYLILALDNNHPFWKAKEEKLPSLNKLELLNVPKMLIQRNDDNNVVMLNGGQYPKFHLTHIAEKYSKFAYSTNYGFSVASSYYDFEKCGCDNMLYFSLDNQMWYPRREVKVLESSREILKSKWSVINGVEVITYIIPINNAHIRVHLIESDKDVYTKEGGFAIALHKPMVKESPIIIEQSENKIKISCNGDTTLINDFLGNRVSEKVHANPNLNCNFPTTIIPILTGKINKDEKTTFISLVSAYKSDLKVNQVDIKFDNQSKTLKVDDKVYQL